MNYVLQILAAGGGTAGFCLTFNVERQHILAPTVGGALCWAFYLLFTHFSFGIFSATFIACFAVGIYGELLARIKRVPTTIYFIPSCIPLVPGANLYYTIMDLIRSDWQGAKDNAAALLLYALAIALGLLSAQEFIHLYKEAIVRIKSGKHT